MNPGIKKRIEKMASVVSGPLSKYFLGKKETFVSGITRAGLTLLTGQTANADETDISLPTGYTLNNTLVLSVHVFVTGDGWAGIGSYVSGTYGLSATLRTSILRLNHPHASLKQESYKVLIARH